MNSDHPTPLLREGGDDFERALLRAGQREKPPAGADRRLLELLGLGGGAVMSPQAPQTAWQSMWLGPKGWLASAAVVIAVTGIGRWALVEHHAADTSGLGHTPVAAVMPPSDAPGTASHDDAPEPSAVRSIRASDLPSASPTATESAHGGVIKGSEKGPAVVHPRAGSSHEVARTSNSDVEPSLTREVELLTDARSALTRGDFVAARRTLDIHDREFVAGPLLPESRVLRIEALVRSGNTDDHTRAETLAKDFLSAHPTGPHARRVRSLVERIQD